MRRVEAHRRSRPVRVPRPVTQAHGATRAPATPRRRPDGGAGGPRGRAPRRCGGSVPEGATAAASSRGIDPRRGQGERPTRQRIGRSRALALRCAASRRASPRAQHAAWSASDSRRWTDRAGAAPAARSGRDARARPAPRASAASSVASSAFDGMWRLKSKRLWTSESDERRRGRPSRTPRERRCGSSRRPRQAAAKRKASAPAAQHGRRASPPSASKLEDVVLGVLDADVAGGRLEAREGVGEGAEAGADDRARGDEPQRVAPEAEAVGRRRVAAADADRRDAGAGRLRQDEVEGAATATASAASAAASRATTPTRDEAVAVGLSVSAARRRAAARTRPGRRRGSRRHRARGRPAPRAPARRPRPTPGRRGSREGSRSSRAAPRPTRFSEARPVARPTARSAAIST